MKDLTFGYYDTPDTVRHRHTDSNDIEKEASDSLSAECFDVFNKGLMRDVLSFVRYLKETFYPKGKLRETGETYTSSLSGTEIRVTVQPLEFFDVNSYIEPREEINGIVYGNAVCTVRFIIGDVGFCIEFQDDSEFVHINLQRVVGRSHMFYSPSTEPESIVKVLSFFNGINSNDVEYYASVGISPIELNVAKE